MELTRELCEQHLSPDLAECCLEECKRNPQPAAVAMGGYLLLEIGELLCGTLHLSEAFEGKFIGDIFSAMCTIALDNALYNSIGSLFDETERELASQYCGRKW